MLGPAAGRVTSPSFAEVVERTPEVRVGVDPIAWAIVAAFGLLIFATMVVSGIGS